MTQKRANPASKTSPAAARKVAAAALKQRAGILARLVSIADDLAAIDARRLDLLDRRDALVLEALDLDVPMADVARHAGTSRQALLKRLPETQAPTEHPTLDL